MIRAIAIVLYVPIQVIVLYPLKWAYFLCIEANNIKINKKMPPKYMWPTIFD